MSAVYRHGLTNPIEVPVALAKAVPAGVAVGIASGTLITPADQAWNTDEQTTRRAFVALFIGQSDQTKAANAQIIGNSILGVHRVNTTGVYDYPVESASFTIGEYIGPAKAVGNALRDDMYKKVSNILDAVAQVVRDTGGTNVTTVRARLLSTISPQAK